MTASFPEILACVICEEVREEKRRLLSLLGVYGVAPNAEILLRELDKPLERLTFALFGGPGGGNFQVRLRLASEQGEVILEPPPLPVSLEESARRNSIAFAFAGLKFPREGIYTFQLLADEQEKFKTAFRVSQGRPEDFA
jgi:hypothetical protein